MAVISEMEWLLFLVILDSVTIEPVYTERELW